MLPGAGSKGLGLAWGGTGKEKEGTTSPWDLLPIANEGAGDAAQLLQRLVFCRLFPRTPDFAFRRPPACFVALHFWSDVWMPTDGCSQRPGLYNAAEEVIKTHL